MKRIRSCIAAYRRTFVVTKVLKVSMALLFVMGSGNLVHGALTLGPLFTDHAVLQRDKPVAIWGLAEPEEEVQVRFHNQTAHARADAEGRWVAVLNALPAIAEGAELTVTGRETITLKDVVVGEVWLCSGQSNMVWTVARSDNAEQEIAAANFPAIRHIKIQGKVAASPQRDVKTTGWELATADKVGDFTAVGYFFGRHLHRELGVPVGLINSAWAGSQIEAWLSRQAIESDPAFAVIPKRWSQILADYPKMKAEYDRKMSEWQSDQAKSSEADATAKKRPSKPELPFGPGHYNTPSGLYNSMIHPLLPYALRGTIWYQGEGNAARAGEYAKLFSTLITSWRADFGQGEFPFYWVQLANRGGRRPWPELREAQTETLKVPNTGQALAIDIGDSNDTHPRNKQEVGRRLALIALAKTYGRSVAFSGPQFLSAQREGGSMRVRFSHADGGLVVRGGPVQSLEVAGEDGVYVSAEGTIEGDTLVARSSALKHPVAVRYAWHPDPKANLYNQAGLPVAPFRSLKP
jgi:sialate O-acetylesterase